MIPERYDNILICLIIATMVMLDILAIYIAYSVAGVHSEAVRECLAMNQAANATVCLV